MDLMIDLETVGKAPGSAILSLGAVAFDRDALYGHPREWRHLPGMIPVFYRRIDLQSCLDMGLGVDASTITWWMEQEEASRQAAWGGPEQARYVGEVLGDFAAWCSQIFQGDWCVWSHGASFDVPIFEAAWARWQGGGFPWHYARVRDTRTVFDLAGFEKSDLERAELAHHALFDAQIQVHNLQRALGRIRNQTSLFETDARALLADLENAGIGGQADSGASMAIQGLRKMLGAAT